jgi:hypothetical protein
MIGSSGKAELWAFSVHRGTHVVFFYPAMTFCALNNALGEFTQYIVYFTLFIGNFTQFAVYYA